MLSQSRAPEWLTSVTYAHRGLHSQTVPENSLKGAERAIKAGLGIECDVQRSRDGTAFVFHDWTLDRLTDAYGDIGDHDDQTLQLLSLRGSDQTPVPLARFLAAIDGRVPLLVEVKSKPDFDVIPTCESVCRSLQNYRGPHAVMSFDPKVSAWFQSHSPKTCRGLVGTDSLPNGFENVWRQTKIVEKAKPVFLALDRRDLARPEASEWRASGLPLLSWTIATKEHWAAAEPLADALIAEGEALV